MRYPDDIVEFVLKDWELEKSKPNSPEFLETPYERIAFHVNRYFHKGRKRFFPRDAEAIVTNINLNRKKHYLNF